MTKTLSKTELAAMAVPIPMSRADKLERWASLVEKCKQNIFIFHNLEYHHRDWPRMEHPQSAFAVAFADKVLREAGLEGQTVEQGRQFFQLSYEELHAFSCNCGGEITNKDMAGRIRAISNPSTGARIVAALALSFMVPALALAVSAAAVGVAKLIA